MYQLKRPLLKYFNLLYFKNYELYRVMYGLYKLLTDRDRLVFLKRIIKPGMRVVDVGANIGFYTQYLAKIVKETGEVYAFEPESTNFTNLKKSCSQPNIVLNNVAVGSKDGFLQLYISSSVNVDHQTYDNGHNRQSKKVKVISLDEYFAGKKVDFIKIDTQGFELEVLKGAKRLLTKHHPILLLECWPAGLVKSGTSPKEVLQFLDSLGYKTKILDDISRKDLLRTRNQDYYTDILAMPSPRP